MATGRAAALARLAHMHEAVEAITNYASRGRAALDTDPALRDAMLYQVVVLGEAAKAVLAVDPTIAAALPEIEWSPIARMRDRVVHHYWATDPEILWATATVAVPELRLALRAAIARLTGGGAEAE